MATVERAGRRESVPVCLHFFGAMGGRGFDVNDDSRIEVNQVVRRGCVERWSASHACPSGRGIGGGDVLAARMPAPLSRRKSAIVLKSSAMRPVCHISSTLRWHSRSSRRLEAAIY